MGKKAKVKEQQKPKTTPILLSILLAAIVLLGLGLRLCGIGHGLTEGEVYHPDAPKQIWAVEMFRHGNYFFRLGNYYYDGYPFFYSRIVEYLWRGIGLAKPALKAFFGVDLDKPSKMALFWTARLVNVAFSTSLLLIIYAVGKKCLDRTTALLAAVLLAINPMDITTAHEATNDTTMSFFANLSLIFALRMFSAGRPRDYILAGVAVAFTFSAKYHGGIVGLTCLVAHLCRYWPPRRLLEKKALARLGLLGGSFVVGFCLATPSMFIAPGKILHDVWRKCRYSSRAGLTREQLAAGFFNQVCFSIGKNFPVLLRSLGLVLLIMAFAGLVRCLTRRKSTAIVASFPTLYLLLIFVSKPLFHRVYLSAAMPGLSLAASALIVEIARWRKIRELRMIAAVLIVAAGAFHLLKATVTEDFFYSRRDTRKASKEWARENLPSFYRVRSSPYTFELEGYGEDEARPSRQIFLQSSIKPQKVPRGFFLLKEFSLEDDALPIFRNPTVRIFANDSDFLRKGFSLPVYQRIPSLDGNEFIFANGADFYRDEKVVEFGKDKGVSHILVAPKPAEEVLVIVRNGSPPGDVRVSLGGVKWEPYLEPHQVRWKRLSGLRKMFPSGPSQYLYNLSASTNAAKVWMMLALTPEQKGTALYQIGEYGAAYPFLAEAAERSTSPVLAAMAFISAKLSQLEMREGTKALLDKAAVLSQEMNAKTFASALGILDDYFRELPYYSVEAERGRPLGFSAVEDTAASGDKAAAPETDQPAAGVWEIGTPPLFLEPGCYLARVNVKYRGSANDNATFKIGLVEPRTQKFLSEKTFPASSFSAAYSIVEFQFEKPVELPECQITIRCDRYVPLLVDQFEIRPDPISSISTLSRLLRLVREPPASDATIGPLDYSPLVQLGLRYAERGDGHNALQCCLLAHKLRPDLAKPIEQMERLTSGLSAEDKERLQNIVSKARADVQPSDFREVAVSFGKNIRLTGYAINRGPHQPGQKIRMTMYWKIERDYVVPPDMIVWVHFLDEKGSIAFQLDHVLLDDISIPEKPERLERLLKSEEQIPPTAIPGRYRINVGLWRPVRDERPAISETDLPHERDSVIIGEVTIGGPSG